MINEKWSLQKAPPKGDDDVAKYANDLFEIAETEKLRLGKNEDFLSNYALYRGKRPVGTTTIGKQYDTPVNLFFANIERTIANITARQPQGEVVDLDGAKDKAEDILSMVLAKWWKESNQQGKTKATARTMEVYGITVEKPAWDKLQQNPEIVLTDPFSFFPAPGNWENIAEEAPYVCFAYLDFVDKTEEEFGIKDILSENAYELLGAVREEYKTSKLQQRTGNYSDPLIPANREKGTDGKIERCLIKEVWLRDNSKRTVKEENPVLDESGAPVLDEASNPLIEYITRKERVYPDGIRKITTTRAKKEGAKDSYVVLDDSANPNINPSLDPELSSKTYPWGRLPVYVANSYKDLVTIWGFSAAEQVGDLLVQINQIITKLVNYVINVMAPPLIVQQHCGISKAHIETSLKKGGRLLLMPTTPNARIEFMKIPNLPATFFQVLDLIVRFYDRIYATEEADRGEAPKKVIAASAIVALQERNQILMQAKITSIEKIVEERSRWCIGLYQNFGTRTEMVNVADIMTPFTGVKFAGRKFSYVIEAGSTTPRTSLQIQEMALKLYEVVPPAIDRRALLEAVNFPGWQAIIERVGETQLDAALQILIEAGLEEEEAAKLKEFLMIPDQGPGGSKTSDKKTTEAKTAKTGKPKSEQGKTQ